VRSITLRGALLAALGLLAFRAPVDATDSLFVGLDAGNQLGWRNVADWAAVERVTVTYDSLFKWDVSPGDNLAPGMLRRGGRILAIYEVVEEDSLVEVIGPLPNLDQLVDGDGTTIFDPDHSGEVGVPRALRVIIDLGASFSINRIRLYPRLDEQHRIRFPQQFTVLSSGGGSIRNPFRVISQLHFSSIRPNSEPVVDRVFASREIRFLQIQTDAVQPWELAEIEIYGDGSVPVGQFQSTPLPARHAFPVWGRVRYEGGDITNLPVVMQTRTGPDRTPVLYYRYTGVADDVEETFSGVWGALPEEEQGPVLPNPEWSAWSTVSNGFIRSTGLHRFIQIRLRFSEPGTIIRQLIIEYAQPALVKRLQAEVHPRQVSAGEEHEFTLSVLSHMITSNPAVVTGFRQMEVLTSAAVAAIDRVLIDDVSVPYSSRIRPGEGFTVNLGQRIDQDGTFLQIIFRAALFHDATRFETRVAERRFFEGKLESVYQTAEAADVDLDSPGGELVVRLPADEELPVVGNVALTAKILTPNEDGVNDMTTIGFDLFKLTQPASATVEIFGLDGRRIRSLLAAELGDGHHDTLWDGTDDAGRSVSPGVYIYRVAVDGDDGTIARQGLLGVVY
jgi:hypothetical protein